MQRLRWIGIGLLLAGSLWAGYRLGRWWQRLQLEEVVRRRVVTTVQQEVPASFLVVGTATVMVTVEASSHKEWLGIDLGTTTARVRVPGTVHYGFDVRALRPEMIRLRPDRVVEVVLPPLAVQAVEPQLEALEIETQVGWARLYRSSGRRMEQEALRQVNAALRRQAEAYLTDSPMPRHYAAEALRRLLVPVLAAVGIDSVQVVGAPSRILVEE
ncbi:DUF4230 domain-containing protein [Rhodothermus marinus]|uniref:DUF4230 domain-containing protein n=1 Tax=Rhodothermus marinus (strain ATCC 43812 / DSM 4252 / R-10) TaxID=518766 RepID=D0MF34_RHOM4|nr:DUF4230 domain-containing protein [Rhodothermus marinus]ACY49290.1 hypothetical protein Rmar_2412 [Rhodothermus marinus DSM 4252]